MMWTLQGEPYDVTPWYELHDVNILITRVKFDDATY